MSRIEFALMIISICMICITLDVASITHILRKRLGDTNVKD